MIDFPIKKIKDICAEFGAEITPEKAEKLNLYGNLLLEWNEKINLTAITDPEEVVIKHFLDCILFLKHIEIPQNAKVIDVGTGAGFPGVVLKIMREDIHLTLLDGLNKRIVFLNDVLEKLNLSAKTIHARAEEAGKKAAFREQYDIATARAVARLNVLAEYCLPFVKVGGSFVAMKGPSAESEVADAAKALTLLGGENARLVSEKLPTNDERSFIIAKKISQTAPKYPRISAKISKQPL